MKRVFETYAILGPLILTPLAFWFWWRHYNGQTSLALLAVGVPIAHGYIVPAIGTNVLKMWAFTDRLRVGSFRPQHGFVFGSATAMIALPFFSAPGEGDALLTGLVIGAVLLAINWLYDALAIRAGILEVFNEPWAQGKGAIAIAGDYVIWFFGLFGVLYGAGLCLVERWLGPAPTASAVVPAGVVLLIATMVGPSVSYIIASRLIHGHSGCRPVKRFDIGRRPS